jgi:S1-C subfamily serine protease
MLPTIAMYLAAIAPGAEPPAPPAAVRERGLAATVRVTDPDGGGVGTGVVFAVRDGYVYVLTAAHVLGPDSRPRVETFRPANPLKPDSTHERCDLLFRTTDADVAVVRLPEGKREWAVSRLAPPPAGGTSPESGWAVGCDEGGAPRIQPVALVGRKLVRRKDGSTAFFWEARGDTEKGRSGGPLLDGDGRLMGVCSGTQRGTSYYVHPDEIRAALRAHRLGWAVGDK